MYRHGKYLLLFRRYLPSPLTPFDHRPYICFLLYNFVIIFLGIPRYINDGWYPPPEVPIENETNDYIRFKPNSGSRVNCGRPLPKTAKHCGGRNSTHFCLFNLRDDPCEVEDLAGRYPDVFQALMTKLEAYKSKMVPARRTMIIDPRSNPKLHNGVWEPWIKLEPWYLKHF